MGLLGIGRTNQSCRRPSYGRTGGCFSTLPSRCTSICGQIEGIGKNGALQLYALPAGQVRIDLDADGNGVADQTKTVTWDWLF